MCGRFNIIDDAATRALLDSLGIAWRPRSRVNVAPTESIPAVVHADHGNEVHEMRWWLTPSWAPQVSNQYSMFNARVESLETSKAFRGPYKHRRCIIPASSFIEWRKTSQGAKQPYLVTPSDGHCFAFAGLWDIWEKQDSYLESCTIVTTQAVQGLQWLHNRMPLLLSQDDMAPWLDSGTDKRVLDEIKSTSPNFAINAYPVSPELNNSRLKDIRLLEPIDDPIEIKH